MGFHVFLEQFLNTDSDLYIYYEAAVSSEKRPEPYQSHRTFQNWVTGTLAHASSHLEHKPRVVLQLKTAATV